MILRAFSRTVFKIALIGIFIAPVLSFAQTSVSCVNGNPSDKSDGVYCSLTTIPGLTDKTVPTDPVKTIKNIYGVSIGIAAILAIGMIIWAGIEYATVESITGKSDAKERWQGALWGLLLLLGSYLILKTINVDLININLDLGKPAVGEKVSKDALQNAIDDYSNSLLNSSKDSAANFTQQKNTKEAQLDALIAEGKGGSPEAQELEGEIEHIRTEIMRLEQNRSATATCYSSTRRSTATEFCFTSAELCNAAQIRDTSIARSFSKTACTTLTPEKSQGKIEFCVPFKITKIQETGLNKKNTLNILGTNCSPSPNGCQDIRSSLAKQTENKKEGEDGYIYDIGFCAPRSK